MHFLSGRANVGGDTFAKSCIPLDGSIALDEGSSIGFIAAIPTVLRAAQICAPRCERSTSVLHPRDQGSSAQVKPVSTQDKHFLSCVSILRGLGRWAAIGQIPGQTGRSRAVCSLGPQFAAICQGLAARLSLHAMRAQATIYGHGAEHQFCVGITGLWFTGCFGGVSMHWHACLGASTMQLSLCQHHIHVRLCLQDVARYAS
jgi:hypothetical protein